jgi:hypothetical protein
MFEARKPDGSEARRVAFTDLPGGGFVSTVFMGLPDVGDMLRGSLSPRVFETMSRFGERWEDYVDRYATWDEAEAGHAAIVAAALAALEGRAAAPDNVIQFRRRTAGE